MSSLYKQHPLSAAWPPLSDQDFEELVQSIKKIGLVQAIVRLDGRILDGWHRHRACLKAGKPERFIDYHGDNPLEFIRACNRHRRHITKSQIAIAEVSMHEWFSRGKGVAQSAANGHSVTISTAQEMAANAGVGLSTVKQAKAVVMNGSDELQKAVKAGAVSLVRAAAVAKKPKDQQAKALREKAKPKAKPKAAPAVLMIPKKKYDELEQKFALLQENCIELGVELESCEALRANEHVKQMKIMHETLKTTTRRRDELMNQVAEMRRQLNFYERELKKLGWSQRLPKKVPAHA